MYCDLWLQYIQVRKLFKGGNYSRKYGNCIYVEIILLFLFHSRRWKREQQKAEIMRGFPPTYLNGPQAPNPHLAATYMANLNKAAAYAQAAAAVANNTMPRHYSYQVSFKYFRTVKQKKPKLVCLVFGRIYGAPICLWFYLTFIESIQAHVLGFLFPWYLGSPTYAISINAVSTFTIFCHFTMANLNKAAAYTQAAAAVANNTMPRHYSYQVESIQVHIFRSLISLVLECM